jgi:3-hydroxy-9,10-secoandrosta-1,3,5(10)-triene-9,17-dione monooxygenase reductase component
MAVSSPPPAVPETRALRDALGRFATGVAMVTAAPEAELIGLIVNSLTSVSLDPPLILFCPSRGSVTWSRMRRAGRFAVNVLGRDLEAFAARAAPPGSDRFAGVTWTTGRGGAPLLTDALASLECTIVGEHPGGDHWIVVGRVDELHLPPTKDPLIFFGGGFHGLQDGRRPCARPRS